MANNRNITLEKLEEVKFKGIGFINIEEAKQYQKGWNDAIDYVRDMLYKEKTTYMKINGKTKKVKRIAHIHYTYEVR